jgi:16S rRNA (guanine527-N7)-methyltransferase
MRELLAQGAKAFNLSLTPLQLDQFERYFQELVDWNQRFNLTRITEPSEVAVKHFLDSLSVFPALSDLPPNFSLIDVGTGAGFPGVPLKIVLPELKVTLLDSTGKKTKFLLHLVESLAFSQVSVITARAEDAARQTAHREQYDVTTARAVSPLATLAEYTLPFVKVGGQVIAQKGIEPIDEVKAAENALKILGGKVKQIIPVAVPALEAARHLVIIEKIKSTPKQYPRQAGLPAKKPL